MALNDLGEQNDDWFGQNAPPTPQKSFGNPTLDAIASAFREVGHEPTRGEVMQFGTKIDAKYFQKIQQQIRQTYAGQTQQQTATQTPQGPATREEIESIIRKYGPVVSVEALKAAQPELNARGVHIQNEERGDVRPRFYIDTPNGKQTVDVGDFGGGWTWVDRGMGGGDSGGGTLLQPFTESFNAKPFEAPAPFVAPTADEAFNDQGFQGVLKRGQSALEKSAAARGTLLTTGTLQELGDYTQDTAAQQYDKVYGRKLGEYELNYGHASTNYDRDRGNALQEYGLRHDLFNESQDRPYAKLLGLANLGRGLDDGANYANAGSNLYTGLGNAQGASAIASGNAWQNAGTNLANLGGYYYGQYQNGRRQGQR
jgi:hypothetical protein